MTPDDQRRDQADEPLVSDIMTPVGDVVVAAPEMTVHELVVRMQETGASGMPVVDSEGFLVGIVTEGDLIVEDADLDLPGYFRFAFDLNPRQHQKEFEERLRKAVGATVADVMTTEVDMTMSDQPASEAATIMVEKNINRVPVVDADDRLLGVVTRMDIIRMLGL